MKSIVEYLPIKDKENPRLLIFSFLLLFLSTVLLVSNIFFLLDPNTPLAVNISNFLVWGVNLFFFFYCRTSRSLVLSSNIILGISIVVLFVSLMDTGGLYSVDKVWAIFMICTAFLFAGVRSGIVFTVLSLGGITIYYIGENQGFWDHKAVPQITDPNYIYLTVFCAIVILAMVLFAFVRTLDLLQKKNAVLVENRFEELNLILEKRSKEVENLRNKLARDFHDLAGNKLATIKMISGVLNLKKEDFPESIKESVQLLETSANDLFENTRDFIWSIDSRNSSLDEIVFHIQDFANGFLAPFDMEFRVDYDVDAMRKHKVKTENVMNTILLFKEGFTNAVKYSKCQNMKLTCVAEENSYTIVLEDDGIGFDVNAFGRKSGLKNMLERAESVGCTLQILSEKDKGTKIFLKTV